MEIGKIEKDIVSIEHTLNEYVTKNCLEEVTETIVKSIADFSNICRDYSDSLIKELDDKVNQNFKELQHLINCQQYNIEQLYDKVEELEDKNKLLSKIVAGCVGAIVGIVICWFMEVVW